MSRERASKGFYNEAVVRERAGLRIAIQTYYPEAVEVLGETIPSQSVVEEMLLAYIEPKPILNREATMRRGKPSV